jgi:hypothetical protein
VRCAVPEQGVQSLRMQGGCDPHLNGVKSAVRKLCLNAADIIPEFVTT